MAELSEYVTLVSNDGFEFKVRRDAACISDTIRRMLDPASASFASRWEHAPTDTIDR
jgi:elongin-C